MQNIVCKRWGGPFAIKGLMSVEDAKRAVDIGASAILLSNHGGRQLDGSRSPFDQLPAIKDAVGDKLEIILDGGIRRGTHVLKALSLGATACSFGKGFLFGLGAGGQAGVEQVLKRMRDELRRDMILLGCKTIKELKSNLKLHTGNAMDEISMKLLNKIIIIKIFMKLAKNLERLGTESAFSILAEAKKLEAQGKEMIHLGLGQPDFKSPKHVVEAAKKAIDDGHHGYVLANGTLECREAVSRKIKALYTIRI